MAAKPAKLVLALSGSPRHANTDAVLKTVLDGAGKAGARTRFIRLADLDISGCVACYYCHTHTTCRIKDDMTKVYRAIKSADAVVFGTPVYWFTMSAQLKAPLDRLFALAFGPGKLSTTRRAAVVTLCADDTIDEMAAPIVDAFKKGFKYLNMKFAGNLALQGLPPADAASRWAANKKALALGAKLAR